MPQDPEIKRTQPLPATSPVQPSEVVKAERSEQNPAPKWNETGSLAKANQVDDWLALEPDGTVMVKSGKVELGTGVETALAQIVAEELDVPFASIRMRMGDTAHTPDEGYTAGSKTIQFGGVALRQASAEARLALLEMASDRLDAAVDELAVRDGVVSVSHHPTQTITYTEMMGGKRFNRAITGKAPLKHPDTYRVVGQPVPRVDLPRKFTGASSYVQDLRLPGMLHGRVVRPPSRGGTLVSFDESSVRDVDIVRLGNFLGVVAAREQDAVRAAKELKVEWTEGAPLPPQEQLFDYIRQQPATDAVDVEQGDVAGALAQAAVRVDATYCQPFHAHASIGPSCAVADFRGDRVIVWCSTQGVFPLRGALAEMLELPPERVQVVHVEGAGCYGHNGFDDVAADAVVLSRAVGQPVRVQWSREQEFQWEPYAPAMVMEVHGGLDAQGRVSAWDYAAWTPTHAARARAGINLLTTQLMTGQPDPPRSFFIGGNRNAPTNYDFPNHRVTMHWLAQPVLRASSFRSLGAIPNTFANESFIDELAAAAHADPLEFRLRHLSDPRAVAVLNAAAGAAGWGTPLPDGATLGGAKKLGRGIAFAQYENDEAYVAMVAQVQVDTATGEVRVERIVVAHDCGLIINPDGLKNQIEGNVIQSLSRALKEQVTWEGARITSVDWDTYPILKFSEVPEVEVILINQPTERAVGAGEPAGITTAPAVANAIYAATGARLRQVPFLPKRVRAAMGKQ